MITELAWGVTGPMVINSFDPETYEPFEYGAILVEGTIDGQTHGVLLSCDQGWAEHPEDVDPAALEAVIRLAKMAVLDKVGA